MRIIGKRRFNSTAPYSAPSLVLNSVRAIVYLDGKTGFGQFDRSVRHSASVVVGSNSRIWLR